MNYLTVDQVIAINKSVCFEHGNRHQCYDAGKVESALCSAIFPGSPPYANGGIIGISGALAFYLTQAHAFFDGNKRTGVTASLLVLRVNGLDLQYPQNPDALANLIEGCAASKISKDEIITWYHLHKVKFTQ